MKISWKQNKEKSPLELFSAKKKNSHIAIFPRTVDGHAQMTNIKYIFLSHHICVDIIQGKVLSISYKCLFKLLIKNSDCCKPRLWVTGYIELLSVSYISLFYSSMYVLNAYFSTSYSGYLVASSSARIPSGIYRTPPSDIGTLNCN